MGELAVRVLREFGLPTLLAVALGALLAWTTVRQSDERVAYTGLLIDQISDLREKVARLEGACAVRSTTPQPP